jgi:hypothetical protein
MLLMSHVPTEIALRALLGRAKDPPRATLPHRTSATCTDVTAVHDAAALREGTLSQAGIHRLAHHLPQCESCRILVAGLVDDAQRAESTGKHEPARALPTDKLAR